MATGTLSTQFELLSGLEDNNAKLITAADVSNIVKSNFQPVMIWSGIFIREISTEGGSLWYPRTNYYNPDFFYPRGTAAGLGYAQQVWQLTNRGSLAVNTTYTNVQIFPNAFLGTQQLYENQDDIHLSTDERHADPGHTSLVHLQSAPTVDTNTKSNYNSNNNFNKTRSKTHTGKDDSPWKRRRHQGNKNSNAANRTGRSADTILPKRLPIKQIYEAFCTEERV